MKLIREHTESVKLIVEDKGSKSYFIEGIFLQAEIRNRNGRVYPAEVLAREVDRYTKEYINKNRAFGELGHPDNPTINLHLTSHIIKELRRDGNSWVGKAKIIDTPNGRIVKSLIDEGAQLGVSSRGVGSLESRNGANVVQDDFMLSTAADIVGDPSAPGAFVEAVMEGKEWVYDVTSKSWIIAEQIKGKIMKMKSGEVEKRKMDLFLEFINRL